MDSSAPPERKLIHPAHLYSIYSVFYAKLISVFLNCICCTKLVSTTANRRIQLASRSHIKQLDHIPQLNKEEIEFLSCQSIFRLIVILVVIYVYLVIAGFRIL